MDLRLLPTLSLIGYAARFCKENCSLDDRSGKVYLELFWWTKSFSSNSNWNLYFIFRNVLFGVVVYCVLDARQISMEKNILACIFEPLLCREEKKWEMKLVHKACRTYFHLIIFSSWKSVKHSAVSSMYERNPLLWMTGFYASVGSNNNNTTVLLMECIVFTTHFNLLLCHVFVCFYC